MKYLVALFTFIFVLGLSVEGIASAPDAICTAKSEAKCKEGAQPRDLSHEMNSLFPEKQKNVNVVSRPVAVEIVSPKFLSKVSGEIKLEWKSTPGANAYHVQIATDPNFKWLVIHDPLVKNTSFNFSKVESGKKYYWRVAALNTNNDSMYTKSNFSSSVFVTK